MSNHYHLAVRVGPVPLARTMGFVQGRFGQEYNRRSRSAGPLWQSRYKAKVIDGERYLTQLIAYIHLNPVAAGVVSDPARYTLCGHAELVHKASARLIDVEGTLALFGETKADARRAYLRTVKGSRKASWLGEEPGGLPWWERERDVPLSGTPAAPRLDALGRSAGPLRPNLEPSEFVQRACTALGISPARLAGPAKGRELSGVRYLVAGVAIERWGLRAAQLGMIVGRRPEAVTRWAARAGDLRQQGAEFRRRYEELDANLYRTRRRQRGRENR